MKRKSILCSVFTLLLLNQVITFPVHAEGVSIKVEAKSALLMEPISGKVIYEVNSHEKLPIASVTKIMTMLLTMEAIDNGKVKLSDKVTISETAKKMGGSSMLLDTGEIRTVEELLKGIAVASGNDAAVAMAEYLSGSEEAFVIMMNESAKALGMNETTFKNCTGLSAVGHISSANDIAIMSRELIKHQAILKYTGTYMETISEGRKSPIGLVNHNKLVRFFKGCDGLKTGFTDDAKYCISATATRDGVRMISIIVGAPTFKTRNRDCSMLLNYGFSKYEVKKVITKDMELDKIYFNKQSDKYFIAKAKEEMNITLEKGIENKIEKKYEINREKREYKKDEIIGKCEIYLNSNLYGKVNIYCDRAVEKSGIFEQLENNLRKFFDNTI